jgi:hypothetical protein
MDFAVQYLKSRVESERLAITTLGARISDLRLKEQLQQASFWLDDVEMFLRCAQTQPRTPEALRRWLAYAEMPLQLAEERRKKIAEYRPHSQTT